MASDGVAPATLVGEPVRTRLDQVLRNAPAECYGLLWMVFDGGMLSSFNPRSASAMERVQAVATLWGGARMHAFAVRELRRGAGAELTECFALIASESSLDARGLVSGVELRFGSWLPGEKVLCNARDAYQMIEGSGEELLCLTVREGKVWLLQVNPFTEEARRTAVAGSDEAVCGPVLWRDQVIVWSRTSVWTVERGQVLQHRLPAGVCLWTRPEDAERVRLPIASRPVLQQTEGLYVPGTRYGAPMLLSLVSLDGRWATSIVPMVREGVLGADVAGRPILVTDGHLLSCSGQSFREVLSVEPLTGQFTAMVDESLSVFFCRSDAGGRQHVWLQAHDGRSDLPVTWRLQSGSSLKECAGFWSMDGCLTAQIFTDGQSSGQEFLSWSA